MRQGVRFTLVPMGNGAFRVSGAEAVQVMLPLGDEYAVVEHTGAIADALSQALGLAGLPARGRWEVAAAPEGDGYRVIAFSVSR